MPCGICGRMVDVLKGPEEYLIVDYCVVHRKCYEKVVGDGLSTKVANKLSIKEE